MSSSVFFKFKSQKEPSRVAFDGTGISVFELKRQIIIINRLGDGTDFDLAIYNQDSNEEYGDDTTIIPRSTSIIARRLPPTKPGRGTAQRYVNGKMPSNALPNAGRREKNFGPAAQASKKPGGSVAINAALTGTQNGTQNLEDLSEEEKIAAMFQVQGEQWNKTQESLANQTPVHRGGTQGTFRKSAAVPSHPTPAGYVCYRCGEKGHWIQACPTNADPNFDGRPRVKRTTGIPRSFLKTVEKPVATAANDSNASNTSVMVNADGEYVVAMPDQGSWESYQKKAATAATSDADAPESKELQERGIGCSICHKLLRDAVKTPCCNHVYCEECIQNALLESDFVCPACEAKEILLDRLLPDTEARAKVEEHKDKDGKKKSPPAPAAAVPQSAPPATRTSMSKSPPQPKASAATPVSAPSNKRKADEDLGPEVPRGPAAMRNTPGPTPFPAQEGLYAPQPFQHQYPQPQQFSNGYSGYDVSRMGMNGMAMNGFNGPPMGMGMNGYYDQQMYQFGIQNPMGGGNMPQYPNMNQMAGPGMMPNHMMSNHGMVPNHMMTGIGNPAMQFTMPMQMGSFSNQQKTVFSEPFPSEEDSPYMRQPINPHRHARPKRVRPSDFKAVGGDVYSM